MFEGYLAYPPTCSGESTWWRPDSIIYDCAEEETSPKLALGLLSCFPFRLIWRTVAHMSKVFKVSRNFTIRGAKLIHADSAEQAIAIATAEDHPEFFEGRLGSNIGHDVWTHVRRVSSDNEDLRVEEVS